MACQQYRVVSLAYRQLSSFLYGFYWSVEYEKLYKTSSSQCSKLAALAAESYSLFDSASNLFNNARAPQSWIVLCENAKLLCELRRLSNYSRMFMKENKRFSNPYGKGLCLAEYVLRKIDSLPPSLQNQMAADLTEIKGKMNAVKKIRAGMSISTHFLKTSTI